MKQYSTNYAKASTPAYTFSQKWGDDPFTALGHTQAPNALIDYSARIGLGMSECWLITCILKFKHTPDHPYPSQAKLGEIVGKDEETVRRILKSIERKGMVVISKVRGDMGHFTHSVYDFTPLRATLNEAYYADHPQERPAAIGPVSATMQKCTVVQPPCKNEASHRIKNAVTTVRKCGPNQSLKEEIEKEEKDVFSLSLSQEQTKPEGPSLERQARKWVRQQVGSNPPVRAVMDRMYEARLAEMTAEAAKGETT